MWSADGLKVLYNLYMCGLYYLIFHLNYETLYAVPGGGVKLANLCLFRCQELTARVGKTLKGL